VKDDTVFVQASMPQMAQYRTISMKRLGDPDDIGKVALFLASGMLSYMTGSQIIVDGGEIIICVRLQYGCLDNDFHK